jgi:hypothetical protein
VSTRSQRSARREGSAQRRASVRRRRAVAALVAVAALAALSSPLASHGSGVGAGTAHAAKRIVTSTLHFRPVLGVPLSDVKLVGAAPGEVWAEDGTGNDLIKYTDAGGWQTVVVPGTWSWADQQSYRGASWSNVQVTRAGGVDIAFGGTSASLALPQHLVVRDPGGSFNDASDPSSSGSDQVLASGETLFSGPSSGGSGVTQNGASTMAAITESDGKTGALIAPVLGASPTANPGILHYDGSTWTREPICNAVDSGGNCATPASPSLNVLAVAAADPTHAWLLASGASSSAPPVLYQRVVPSSGTPYWLKLSPATGALGGSGTDLKVGTARSRGPLLTATTQGVWVDLIRGTGSSAVDESVLISAAAGAGTIASYCYSADSNGFNNSASTCPNATGTLGAPLPTGIYGSAAWPGNSDSDPGTRIITGVNGGRAILRLTPGQSSFSYVAGDGPNVGTTAAFTDPTDGWLGYNGNGGDGYPAAPTQVTATQPSGNGLTEWPVDFREPLTAIAAQPGTTAGAGDSGALAVGIDGAAARYVPDEGWEPEYLYNSAGVRQTPNLRGVAWPESELAFAVGDDGAMWRWNGDTDLWEPDPGKPYNFEGNLTGVAFDPNNPQRGYAIGKQGVLLDYEKNWETDKTLPDAVKDANFTSIAFAGDEALVAYRTSSTSSVGTYSVTGGVIENDGSGWQIDTQVTSQLAAFPRTTNSRDSEITKVAGLPDGGAVAAGPGIVLERDSATSAWRLASQEIPITETYNIAALAAIRTSSGVRALMSVDTTQGAIPSSVAFQNIDNSVSAGTGAPAAQIGPDPFDEFGFLLRETDNGWQDIERSDYIGDSSNFTADQPDWPAPVLALLTDPTGESGWAVGGQTGEEIALGGGDNLGNADTKTAVVERFGAGPAAPGQTSSAVSIPSGQATFAIGGGAQCTILCSDLQNQKIGPDVWLQKAVQDANDISGLHAFIYTGGRLAAGANASLDKGDALTRELSRYASLLNSGGGDVPTYAAIDPDDVGASAGTGAKGCSSGNAAEAYAAFTAAMGSLSPSGQVPDGTPAPPSGLDAYAFDSPGEGGTVRVIVLDQCSGQTGISSGQTACPKTQIAATNSAYNQFDWLCDQLGDAGAAGIPAIVVGNRGIVTSPTTDDLATAAALVAGGPAAAGTTTYGASAYVYDSASVNSVTQVVSGGKSIPAIGDGSLGYGGYEVASARLDASGIILLSVDVAGRNASTNVAPVSEQLEPVIGSLAIDATQGTLLKRSAAYLFDGLAERPEAGYGLSGNGYDVELPDPYVPIPETCQDSAACAEFIAPTYTFTSSNPDIANFVEPVPTSISQNQVEEGKDGPIPDSHSGLLCAYNAGTTTITLSTGGLSYAMKVTVQAGSVRQPCGTVPLINPPVLNVAQPGTPIAPAQSPTPATFEPTATPVAPPPAPATHPTPAAHVKHPAPAWLPTPPLGINPLVVIVPPPVTAAAEPVPPSGTAPVNVSQPVSQTVVAPKEQERREHAIDVAHNKMSAYQHHRSGSGGMPPALPALVLLLAVAAAGYRCRPERRFAYVGDTHESPTRRSQR